MCRPRPNRDVHSFVVRIWHETEDDDSDSLGWRGTIDHVRSGKRLYFHDLETFLRFVEEQAGLKAGEEPATGAGIGGDRGSTGTRNRATP
jgi:hypothetical protein